MSEAPKRSTYWERVFPRVLYAQTNLDEGAVWDSKMRWWRDPFYKHRISATEAESRRDTLAKWNTIHRIEDHQHNIGNPIGYKEAHKLWKEAGGDVTEKEKEARRDELIAKGYSPVDAYRSEWEEREEAIRMLVSPP